MSKTVGFDTLNQLRPRLLRRYSILIKNRDDLLIVPTVGLPERENFYKTLLYTKLIFQRIETWLPSGVFQTSMRTGKASFNSSMWVMTMMRSKSS